MNEMVECAIFGTSPRAAAAIAKLRVDQCVMCRQTPAGSQQASISIPTRCRGGKRPGPTLARGVLDDLYPDLFVPPAEIPDRRSRNPETFGQPLDDDRWIRHGQQDPCSTRSA